MDVTNLIKLVISTLNDVEVKGKGNLDKLLGSINALESVVQIMEAAPTSPMQTENVEEVANG